MIKLLKTFYRNMKATLPGNKVVKIVKSDVSDKVKHIVKDTKNITKANVKDNANIKVAKVKVNQINKVKENELIVDEELESSLIKEMPSTLSNIDAKASNIEELTNISNPVNIYPSIPMSSTLPNVVKYTNIMRNYLKPFGIDLARRYELRLMQAHRFILELSSDEKNVKQLLEKKELSSYELVLALHYNPELLLSNLSIEEGKELAHIYIHYSYDINYILQDFSNLDISLCLVDVTSKLKHTFEPSKYKVQNTRAKAFETCLKEFTLAIENSLVKLNDLDMEKDNNDYND
jgi:hypothetical protein